MSSTHSDHKFLEQEARLVFHTWVAVPIVEDGAMNGGRAAVGSFKKTVLLVAQ